jgi:anti-sigma28 factor (negative regulator of flagellin synthesis)
MKVTNTDTAALSGAAQAASAAASSAAAARAKVAATQKSSDYTQRSSLSGHLKSLTADGRQAQVESVGKAVEAGRYKADSNAVSAKMIEESMRSGATA